MATVKARKRNKGTVYRTEVRVKGIPGYPRPLTGNLRRCAGPRIGKRPCDGAIFTAAAKMQNAADFVLGKAGLAAGEAENLPEAA